MYRKSKSEREKLASYIKKYMWNLEKRYRWTSFESKNRGADIAIGHMVTMGEVFARVRLQQPGIQPKEVSGVSKWDSLSVFHGLPVYSKFKILFYTFTRTLGQRFDIFSFPSPRCIISINHCCSSEFLLQRFSPNQPYHVLSTSSNVSYS